MVLLLLKKSEQTVLALTHPQVGVHSGCYSHTGSVVFKIYTKLQRDSLQVTVKFKFPTEIMLMIMKCRINDFY